MNSLEDKIKPEAMTKTQLAARYKVCIGTFSKWIKPHSEYIGMRENTYLYTPDQVKKIYEVLGEP